MFGDLHRVEKLHHLFAAEHHRQGPGLLRHGDRVVEGPPLLERDPVEEAECRHGDDQRARRQTAFGGQVDLVGADLLQTETSRGTAEVTSEPRDGLDLRPVRVGGGLRDGVCGAGKRAAGVRLGMLCGADVRPVRGPRGGPGREQHGGWLGRIVRFGGRRAAGGASECSSRGGGSGCTVRVWGCNGPVVEEGLVLNRATRRQIQLGLRSAGFDPGGADGLFGPRARTAIRNWQSSRGGRATGYLDGAAVEALGTAGGSGPVRWW